MSKSDCDSFYRHQIDEFIDSKRPPDEALCFLTWAPDQEVTDRERCLILRAVLEVVLERLVILEAKDHLHAPAAQAAEG